MHTCRQLNTLCSTLLVFNWLTLHSSRVRGPGVPGGGLQSADLGNRTPRPQERASLPRPLPSRQCACGARSSGTARYLLPVHTDQPTDQVTPQYSISTLCWSLYQSHMYRINKTTQAVKGRIHHKMNEIIIIYSFVISL